MSSSSIFSARLRAHGCVSSPGTRRWIYLPYDQLSTELGPLAREPASSLGVVLIESAAKAGRRPYHKQKLALILANQRHFALELAQRGIGVRYLAGEASYAEQLRAQLPELGPLRMMEAAELELREELAPLVAAGQLELLPHEGWLSTAADFAAAGPERGPWRMDSFYRAVRRRTGILMDAGKPVGGRFSFDGDNRKAWRGDPPAPRPPSFVPDAITREVGELIEVRFGDHPGQLDLAALPSTRADAQRLWDWFVWDCLPHFGPYQDAMSVRSSSLFHARISGLLHLHRLLPWRVVRDALEHEDERLGLASREGFIRQIIGWREYVRHVHRATAGLREVPTRNAFGARNPLPPAFWGGAPSGLACLDAVVEQVWREGYGHHITRLMVLSNLATLLGVRPGEISEWFWVAYTDAYDWVVEPNVLGMGVHALGDLMTTKPYVCGGAYINRMGDFCKGCAFDPKRDCPVTALYWAFIARHAEQLKGLGRMQRALWSLAKRAPDKRARDLELFELCVERLGRGEMLTPDESGAPAKQLSLI